MGGFWFTQESHAALSAARKTAIPWSADVPHLLGTFCFTSFPQAEAVLQRAGISRQDLQALFFSKSPQAVKSTTPFGAFVEGIFVEAIPGVEGAVRIKFPPQRDADYSPALMQVLETAMQLASAREERYLGTGHLLLGLFLSGHPLVEPLKNRPQTLEAAVPLLGEPGDLAGEEVGPDC